MTMAAVFATTTATTEAGATATTDVIRGLIDLPDRPGQPPLWAILIPGPGTNMLGPHRLHRRLALTLAACGVAAVRFDYRGRGDSDGEEAGVGVASMIEDVLAVHRHLAARGAERFVLVANCLGCVVGLRAMEQLPEVLGGVFLAGTEFGGAATARRDWRELARVAQQYWAKAQSPQTWRRLARGEVDVRGIWRAVSNEAGRRYRDLVAPAEPPARRGGPNRWAAFVWGAQDPGTAHHGFYARFCGERGWSYERRVLEGADRNFSTPAAASAVEEVVVKRCTAELGAGGEASGARAAAAGRTGSR
jgi:pimeloyl-ACP methyl ester carboxylesterase